MRQTALSAKARVDVLVRRAVTLTGLAVLLGLAVPLFPAGLAGAALWDAVRASRWTAVRCTLSLGLYLACEAFGVLACLAFWPLRALGLPRYLAAHYALQRWWSGALYGGVSRLFGLRTRITGGDALAPDGPLLVLARHASQLDSILPVVTAAAPHGLQLRYVLKHELLWSPALDIVGNRLPNVFVRRGVMGRREIRRVAALADGLGARQGLLIFPEGTRFSEQKRQHALARAARRRSGAHSRVQRYRHVLPPQLGGVLAALAAMPAADVVFMAHAGLEGMDRPAALLAGATLGRRVDVHFWRVPAAGRPSERDELTAWLYDQWGRLDDWVAAREEG